MSEPRWLNPHEQHSWRTFIEGFRALVDVLDRELQADSGLSHAYYEILIPLSEHPDRSMRMSELADITRSSRSRLSHAVSRLEERGWVQRVECETDKRGQLAQLTDTGFAVVAAAAPPHVATVRKYLIDQLTPDQLTTMGEIGEIMLATSAASDLPPRRS
ncbi:MarR family transcriptional regulator [Jatrophihabitans telluris]|uniref:MarR family transcriptional regulator n=1 Tax=Jatrophihabitans telluris TaxID=2038343 RepID=A0ABY4QYW1_9ACTN|nr:MarR family transcriptional regulator [Jatrophihabitans telluris]UQX88387.1 MarR family transcriptional regulator [Jatrophihabitans telluris]